MALAPALRSPSSCHGLRPPLAAANATSVDWFARTAAGKHARELRSVIRAASGGGAGPEAACKANVLFHGMSFMGSANVSTVARTVTAMRTRASARLRRQYTTQ